MRRTPDRRRRAGAVLTVVIVGALLGPVAPVAPVATAASAMRDGVAATGPGAGPKAAPQRPRVGEVVDGRARFQVVTPSLIRMEYAADRRFEDRPTLTVGPSGSARRAPAFTTRVEGRWRVIRTAEVELRWRRGGTFAPRDLRLRFDHRGSRRTVSPRPGVDHRFLGGWTRALDLSDGREPLNDGILTREGWYVLDDTDSALLTPGARGVPGPGFRVRPRRDGAYRDCTRSPTAATSRGR